ncbi:MAG: two-component system response regulator, partial [Candidatus Hydrothermota bacterium]
MQKHTIYGAQIIGETPYPLFQYAKNIALYHHERFDGKGYPEGLKGKKIPLEARIVAIADVFDALVTSRPYKKAWSIESAIEYIAEERGHHFDPEIANIFLDNIKLVKEIYRKIT